MMNTKPTTEQLALDFVAAIKDRDSLPFNEKWDDANAKADAIIQKVPKREMSDFSDIVSQPHHWV